MYVLIGFHSSAISSLIDFQNVTSLKLVSQFTFDKLGCLLEPVGVPVTVVQDDGVQHQVLLIQHQLNQQAFNTQHNTTLVKYFYQRFAR